MAMEGRSTLASQAPEVNGTQPNDGEEHFEDDLMRSPDREPSAGGQGQEPKPSRPKKRPMKHYARKIENNKSDEFVKRSCYDERTQRNCCDCEETLLYNQRSERAYNDEKVRRLQLRKDVQAAARLAREEQKEKERTERVLRQEKAKAEAAPKRRNEEEQAKIRRQAQVESAAEAARKREQDKIVRKEAAQQKKVEERAQQAEAANRAKAALRGSSWFSAYDLDSDEEYEGAAQVFRSKNTKNDQEKRLQINRLVNRLQMSKSSSQLKQEKENLVTRVDARVFAGIEKNNLTEKPSGEGLTPEEAMIMNVYIKSFKNETKRKQKVESATSKLDRFRDLGLDNTGTLLTAAMIRAWPSKDIEALQARAKHLSSKVSN
jgi:hypothetical protein